MRASLHSLLLCLFLPILVACGTLQQEGWPEELPERAVFERLYQADACNRERQEREDYLQWVRTFYAGNSLAPGWLDMTREVLDGLDAAEARSVAPRLAALGRDIAGEWAKANALRRIDTRHMTVWREALVEAMFQENLEAFLARMEADVAALLAGELDKDSVVYERYHDPRPDFF